MDRARVAAVPVDVEARQAELRHDILAVERLPRIVEDVEHVLLRIREHDVEQVQPPAVEVLALVDHDRVVSTAHHRQRLIERPRQRLVPPLLRLLLRLRRQRAGLPTELQAQLVEGRDVQAAGGRCIGQVGAQRASQGLVEADEQGAEALVRQAARLLPRAHRLAAARRTTISARRCPRSMSSTCSCASVSRTTSRSPSSTSRRRRGLSSTFGDSNSAMRSISGAVRGVPRRRSPSQ
jgi:hypothetical protein